MYIHLTSYFHVKRKYVQSPKLSHLPDRKLSFNELRTRCYSISASQPWQQVPIDIREAACLAFFKNRIKTWKCEDCPCRSCKIVIQNVGYI